MLLLVPLASSRKTDVSVVYALDVDPESLRVEIQTSDTELLRCILVCAVLAVRETAQDRFRVEPSCR